MKPLILIYCYYDESHNVLDTMEVFPYVDLIIIRKTYDFYHVSVGKIHVCIAYKNIQSGKIMDLLHSQLITCTM